MNPSMTDQSAYPLDSQVPPPEAMQTQPLYWSLRRELWENRSVYIAPIVVAAFVLFASLIGTIHLPSRMREARALDPAKQHAAVVTRFSMAPAPIILVTFLVGMFYCLDALNSERRDRSILFWKSLPVSDLTTVLAKAIIPLVVLPLLGFVLGETTQLIMLVVGTAVLVPSPGSLLRLWTEFRFFQEPLIMAYGLIVFALWFAPIYGWLLLVSAWARRATLLWAVLPLFAVSVAERLAFHTTLFASMLKYRVTGPMTEAFGVRPHSGGVGIIDQLSQLTPANFLAAPGLWAGLIFTAACLAAAVRLRHRREPL